MFAVFRIGPHLAYISFANVSTEEKYAGVGLWLFERASLFLDRFTICACASTCMLESLPLVSFSYTFNYMKSLHTRVKQLPVPDLPFPMS